MKIVLYSDDLNLLTSWNTISSIKLDIYESLSQLKTSKNNIIILNYSALGKYKKEIIELLNENENLVLVLHRVPNITTAREVLGYGAKGYGNALMQKHFLLSAVETMKAGMIWLHPEFTSELIAQIPQRDDKDNSKLLDKLTKREKEVALLLKDAYSYKSISQKLIITPRTVQAHAHNIYEKLDVKDRLALALLLK